MSGTGDAIQSGKRKVVELVKVIPVVGPAVGYVLEHWGIMETVFLAVGFLVGWGVVLLGQAPEFLISTYRVTQPPPKVEPKPGHVGFKVLEAGPEWLQPYVFWLEQEGNDLKAKGMIQDYEICLLDGESDIKSTARDWVLEKFIWELKTERDWQVNGYAFSTYKEGSFVFLESVKDAQASVGFTVPAYRKESKLLSIIRVSWKQGGVQTTCKDIRSSVK